MSGIACLLHQLREQLLIQRYTVGLTGPYDLVLQASVDLKSKGEKKEKKINKLLGKKYVFSLQKEESSELVATASPPTMFSIGHSSAF